MPCIPTIQDPGMAIAAVLVNGLISVFSSFWTKLLGEMGGGMGNAFSWIALRFGGKRIFGG